MKKVLFLHSFVILAFLGFKIHKDTRYQSKLNFLVMEMNHLENKPQQIQLVAGRENKCIKNSHNIWVTVSKKETKYLNKQELRSYVETQLNSCSLI